VTCALTVLIDVGMEEDLDDADAGVAPHYGYHGDADLGKDVDRRAQRRQRADDQDQQRQHQERIRLGQRNTNEVQHFSRKSAILQGADLPGTGRRVIRP